MIWLYGALFFPNALHNLGTVHYLPRMETYLTQITVRLDDYYYEVLFIQGLKLRRAVDRALGSARSDIATGITWVILHKPSTPLANGGPAGDHCRFI